LWGRKGFIFLLCHGCNVGLGFLKDREDLLLKVIDYLGEDVVYWSDEKENLEEFGEIGEWMEERRLEDYERAFNNW
jgi:hypothetical protein